MQYLIRYHHLLSNLVQKYIAYKFWETVSDKESIIDYYKYVIRIVIKVKFKEKQQIIQEIKRIVFNAPSDIKQILNSYAEFIIKLKFSLCK